MLLKDLKLSQKKSVFLENYHKVLLEFSNKRVCIQNKPIIKSVESLEAQHKQLFKETNFSEFNDIIIDKPEDDSELGISENNLVSDDLKSSKQIFTICKSPRLNEEPDIRIRLWPSNFSKNTCYMNSGLQCLSNIELLTKFCHQFKQNQPKSRSYFKKTSLFDIYCDLLEELWSGKSGSVSPKAFKSKVSQLFPRFSGFAQNACSELLTSVVGRFHEEDLQRQGLKNDFIVYNSFEEYLQNNNTFVAKNLHGFQRFQMRCNCGQVLVERFEPFVVLHLPQNYVSKLIPINVMLIRNN